MWGSQINNNTTKLLERYAQEIILVSHYGDLERLIEITQEIDLLKLQHDKTKKKDNQEQKVIKT